MKSRKMRPTVAQDEIHRNYMLAKRVRQEFRKLMEMLSEIRDTVTRINVMLDDSNKKSVIFWTEFKRDFPEVKLDEIAYRRLVAAD